MAEVVVATGVRNSSETLQRLPPLLDRSHACRAAAVLRRAGFPPAHSRPGGRAATTEIGEGAGFAVDTAWLVASRLCQNQRFVEHDLGAGVVSVEHGQSAMPVQRGRQVEGAGRWGRSSGMPAAKTARPLPASLATSALGPAQPGHDPGSSAAAIAAFTTARSNQMRPSRRWPPRDQNPGSRPARWTNSATRPRHRATPGRRAH